MKNLLPSLLTLFFLLSPLLTAAQNASGNTEHEAISTIFQEIPIRERLEESPQEMHELFSQNPFQIPSSQNEKMLAAFEHAFDTDSLLQDAQETFQKSYDSEQSATALEWIQTENTQQMLKAEKEFYSLQGMREQVVREYELEQDPPTRERRELIATLIQNRSEAESEVESRMIIFRGMLSAINELNGGQFDEMQLQTIGSNYESQLQSQINQDLSRKYLIMYYGLDNETLKNYGSFYESEAGNWLSNSLAESIHSAYREAADRL